MTQATAGDFVVAPADPATPPARAMATALWGEVQRRYGFEAPDPFDPEAFAASPGGFWLARNERTEDPIGSIALSPLPGSAAELDVMYVIPERRGSGVAQALLAALERHARCAGVATLRLRAGDPQPEAMRFYAAAGFEPIEPFGKWVGDETARCLEKVLEWPIANTPGRT